MLCRSMRMNTFVELKGIKTDWLHKSGCVVSEPWKYHCDYIMIYYIFIRNKTFSDHLNSVNLFATFSVLADKMQTDLCVR